VHLTFYDQNTVHDGIRLELFRTQKLLFQVMFCQYICKYFRCNLASLFITIYTNTTLNDTYGIKTYIPITYRVGSTAFYLMFYVTLEPHRPSLLIINVAKNTWQHEKYTWYIRFSGIFVPLLVDSCPTFGVRIIWNLAKSYRWRLYVWHVNWCYGMSNYLRSGLVKLIVRVQAQRMNKRKYSN